VTAIVPRAATVDMVDWKRLMLINVVGLDLVVPGIGLFFVE
jgi:hypothetical protein